MLVSTGSRTQTHISESKVPADQAGIRLPPPEPQFPRMSPSPRKGKLRVSGPTGLLTRLGSKVELFWSPLPQEPELGRSSRPAGRRERVT